jgi:hypothetical protein
VQRLPGKRTSSATASTGAAGVTRTSAKVMAFRNFRRQA